MKGISKGVLNHWYQQNSKRWFQTCEVKMQKSSQIFSVVVVACFVLMLVQTCKRLSKMKRSKCVIYLVVLRGVS